MPDFITPACDLLSRLPFDCLRPHFMQQALLALLLLAPLTATMGVQVVNLRMAFFADAISHSAFAGVALGLIFSINPHWTMPLLGVAVGLGIMYILRRSALSSDTVIGVFFSAVIAFGLAIVSRDQSVARDLQRFLYGDILTISESEILWLAALFLILSGFQYWSYNRMIYLGLNPALARAHRVTVGAYHYTYAGLLSLVVIFSVWAVGVLLVTALLIVPAAAARNLSRSAGSMFWYAIFFSVTSAVIGLLISAQDWARTATGATIILVAVVWFVISTSIQHLRSRR